MLWLKLTWSLHIAKTINKANITLHAIRHIKKYFTSSEIQQIITSNFFSVLYYNSEIWQLPPLKHELKQQVLSASARALKVFQINPDLMLFFESVHHSCKRATHEQIMHYNHSLTSRLAIINKKIPLIDLNLSLDASKSSTN